MGGKEAKLGRTIQAWFNVSSSLDKAAQEAFEVNFISDADVLYGSDGFPAQIRMVYDMVDDNGVMESLGNQKAGNKPAVLLSDAYASSAVEDDLVPIPRFTALESLIVERAPKAMEDDV